MFSQLIQLQSRLRKGRADVFCFLLFQLTRCVAAALSARSERFAAQTAAAAKSSLDTYPTTPAAPGGPRPARTRFFGDRSSIFEEACEETEREKHAASGKSCGGGSREEEGKEPSEERSGAELSVACKLSLRCHREHSSVCRKLFFNFSRIAFFVLFCLFRYANVSAKLAAGGIGGGGWFDL